MTGSSPAIVLIHGLRLKEGEAQEYGKWKSALNSNLRQVQQFAAADLRMAYYSDELHPEVHVVDGSAGRRRHRVGRRATGREYRGRRGEGDRRARAALLGIAC